MAKPKTSGNRKAHGPLGWLRSIVRLAIFAVFGYFLACTFLLITYRVVDPPITTVHIQRIVEGLGPGVEFSYAPIPIEAIDEDVRHAVVASEDARFYDHNGLDWVEIESAREQAGRRGTSPRGASTITQQLVKNLFLTTHRSWIRKGVEVPLAYLADFILPKERILALYLNVVEWGPGVFGIEEAARYHYGVSAGSLSRNQAARLVVCLPSPRDRRPQSMGRSARRIERRMRQMGW
jgi:monofunctional biosynthetic peptidoglycan transglycosylase